MNQSINKDEHLDYLKPASSFTKSERFELKLAPDITYKIELYSERLGMSKSAFVRYAIEEYIKRLEGKPSE